MVSVYMFVLLRPKTVLGDAGWYWNSGGFFSDPSLLSEAIGWLEKCIFRAFNFAMVVKNVISILSEAH